MSRTSYPLCALVALVLIASISFAPGQQPEPPEAEAQRSSPAYDSLEHVLQAGLGSYHSLGRFELLSTDPLHPVGWLYVTDSTADGDGTEYLISTNGYVIPGPLATSVVLDTKYISTGSASTLPAFLSWIVSNYDHVDSIEDLEVVERVVTPVEL